ncbi:NRDE family protein [Marinomonas sp. 2405UD68-3]|uniref:NRDE family protein n=1 Tax=Marinomonas sp. 2405UD68-3 TaxID=3391835 RepID=UPI0039C98ACA
MCTISWLYNHQGYQIFFNRDEQRRREKAHPPEVFQSKLNNSHYIMPVDPQGNGSWMGVTSDGVSICLLNYYQGNLPKGQLTSRGMLVRNLLELTSYKKVEQYLNTMDCMQYAPFTLLIFSRSKSHPLSVCWDGQTTLKNIQATSPFTSSGVDFPSVSNHRQESYAKLLKHNNGTVDDHLLLKLHRSHLPERSMNSVCMHRGDAKTVSLSHIKIDQHQADYTYWDGSPCATAKVHKQRCKISERIED